MGNLETQTGDWQLDLFRNGTQTLDCGREVVVKLTHWPTARMLSGYVSRFEDSPEVVVRVSRDDLGLPFVVDARLLGKLYNYYAADLYDGGGDGISARPDLPDLIADALYGSVEDGARVNALLQAAIGRQTTPTRSSSADPFDGRAGIGDPACLPARL